MREKDTKTKILDASYQLMLSKGYAATSVGEICSEADVSKGSFYHFFDTKQQCALEMIEHHIAEADEVILNGLKLENLSGPEAALRYVEQMENLSEELFRDGCLIGAFALELSDTHPEMRDELSRVFRKMTDEIDEIFKPFCQEICNSHGPSSRELAEQFLSAVEGGVVLSKAHGEISYVSKAVRGFRKYMELLRQHAVATRA